MTDSTDIMKATKIALKEIVRPWEILCGFTDVGNALVPDIYAKTQEDFNSHIGEYMDAPTPVIDKKTGEVTYKEWDDEDVDEAIKSGEYVRIQNKPKYTRE